MKSALFFIVFFLFVVSCNKHVEAYKKIIPEHDMQELIIDLQLNDAIIRTYANYHGPIFVNSTFYDSIFKKYNVTKQTFLWNLIHYSQQKKISEIYEKAISELTTRKAVIEREIIKQNASKK